MAGDMATRSKLLSFSAPGGEGASGNARLCGGFRSGPKIAGRHRRGRCRSGLPVLFAIVGTVAATHAGDEFHHFGWNACSSCLCPNAPHPHVERRYLVVPGLRSSRIHILDTKPDPRKPKIVKVIEPDELAEKTGYTRPHTVHCGPGGIYVAALGNEDGKAPGGIFCHGSRELRAARPLGSRSRPAAARLRRLVASRLRHHGDQRMGHARHLRERTGARNPAGRQIRPHACISGISPSASMCRRSISATSTSSSSNCAPRMIRPRPTASSTA